MNDSDKEMTAIEVDIPDEEVDTFMAMFSDGAEDMGGEFESLDDLFAVEAVENEGVKVGWPAVPGAWVLFAHPENSRVRYSQLEREHRAKHKMESDEPLSAAVSEGLLGMASFGTSVKGWGGIAWGGEKREFNKANFQKLWTKRRFRKFCYAELAKLGSGSSPAMESIEKN